MIGTAATFLPLALALSSPGFYRYVFFISIGYGFAVAGIALAAIFTVGAGAGAAAIAHALLLAAYGLRLGGYLLSREFQPSFGRERAEIERRNAEIGLDRKLLIWLVVSLLYVVMTAPAVFHLSASAAGLPVDGPLAWIGLAVGVLGLCLESIADLQKAAFKRAAPGDFASRGLYRLVRYPNYLGEMTVWLGAWLAGIPSYGDAFSWIVATTGLVVIWLIMLGSGKRLEEKQDERYGHREDYLAYKKRVRALIPLVGPHSLLGLKVYLG